VHHGREDSFSGTIIHNKKVRNNFILMTFFWTTCSTMYYMFVLETRDYVQMKEEPLNWYYYSGVADVLGSTVGGFMVVYFRPRKSLMLAYGLVAFGSLFLLIFQTNPATKG